MRIYLEVAGRTACAVCLVGALHIGRLLTFSYVPGGSSLRVISVALAVLCSSDTLGSSLHLCCEALLGTAAFYPIGGTAMLVGWCVGGTVQPYVSLLTVAILAIAVTSCKVHPVFRKHSLALSAAGVLHYLQREPARADLIGEELLTATGASAVGIGCALAGALLPIPRWASSRADRSLRASAHGIASLVEHLGAAMVEGAANDSISAGWHRTRRVEGLIGAIRTALAGTARDLVSARWEVLPCVLRYMRRGCGASRKRHQWRLTQCEALSETLDALATAWQCLQSGGGGDGDGGDGSGCSACSNSGCGSGGGGGGGGGSGSEVLPRMSAPISRIVSEARRLASLVGRGGVPVDAALALADYRRSLAEADEALQEARVQLFYAGRTDGWASRADCSASDGSVSSVKPPSLLSQPHLLRQTVADYAFLFSLRQGLHRMKELFDTATIEEASSGANGGATLARPPPWPVPAAWPRVAVSRARAKDGLRLATALLLASPLAVRHSRGLWAFVTIVMVSEAGRGATLRIASLRLMGSVIGVFYGYAALSVCSGLPPATRDAILLPLLGLWAGGCAYIKAASPSFGYLGLVAAFTSGVTLLGEECDALGMHQPDCLRGATRTLTLDRIQLTLLGITSVLGCTWLVFPVNMSGLASAQLEQTLDTTRWLFARTMHVCVHKAQGGAPEPMPEGRASTAKGTRASASRHEPTSPPSAEPAPPSMGAETAGVAAGGAATAATAGVAADGAATAAAVAAAAAAAVQALTTTHAACSDATSSATASVVGQRRALQCVLNDLRHTLLPQADLEPACCGEPPFALGPARAVAGALAAVLSEIGTMHAAMLALHSRGAGLLLPPLLLPVQQLEVTISLSLQMLGARVSVAVSKRAGRGIGRGGVGPSDRPPHGPHRPQGPRHGRPWRVGPRQTATEMTPSVNGDGSDVEQASGDVWGGPTGRWELDGWEEVEVCIASVREGLEIFEVGHSRSAMARIASDRAAANRAGCETSTPSVSNGDILAFNALVHAVRGLVGHVCALARAIERLDHAAEPGAYLEE